MVAHHPQLARSLKCLIPFHCKRFEFPVHKMRWFPFLTAIPQRVLNLVLPLRCAYCGRMRDFLLERQKNYTLGGNHFHPEWNLCEECTDRFWPSQEKFCPKCGSFVNGKDVTEYRCKRCEGQNFYFNRVLAMGHYRDELRTAVLMMKRRSSESLARTLARMFCETCWFPLQSLDVHVILPVPMHPFYRWVRGINDAQVLAEEVGKFLHVHVNERLVRCVRLTLAQRAVRMEERAENVRGMFAPYDSPPDRTRWLGKRALIVDDVMTTGSTVNEVARILKVEFGFADVSIAVLARARGKVKPIVKGVTEIVMDFKEKKAFNRTYTVYRRGKEPEVKEQKNLKFNDRTRRKRKLRKPKKKTE